MKVDIGVDEIAVDQAGQKLVQAECLDGSFESWRELDLSRMAVGLDVQGC